jgi:hypothetical protein
MQVGELNPFEAQDVPIIALGRKAGRETNIAMSLVARGSLASLMTSSKAYMQHNYQQMRRENEKWKERNTREPYTSREIACPYRDVATRTIDDV